MNDEQKPINIDPRCIQEAMRMFFQPIKNEDPQLDFYTMYKREATEYDTEHMQKYNEDLNTTLIFAGLFSAVSSAFVIDIQSKLEPDPAGRSEAYLRAILLTLNRSVSPDENPAAPPAWNGSPTEVVTTSNLLYASLLMSLLAAFVAMLGKQWLNRYLRRTGGSIVERCGDRQRKCDGLEKWPFHFFIESLPVILQIALLFLACGLSRYMWSINTSVARVVVSFTVLGILFYVGIVIAGTSSYECPFQTPVSITLRTLLYSKKTRKVLGSFSPLKTITSFRTGFVSARKSLSLGVHHVRDTYLSSWGILSSSVRSGIRGIRKNIGHRVITLLRALWNAKQRIIQGIRGSEDAALLPIAAGETQDRSEGPQSRLWVSVRNQEALRKLNADNVCSVCWIIRNITDPEALDSAIRLAGTLRWFDGDAEVDPPFDVIVSVFESCFDSNRRLYPGMRARAYLSGRAILQINTRARLKSHECASKYPIPSISWGQVYVSDGDLKCVAFMLKYVGPSANTGGHTFDFLDGADSPWMSNLFVDLARADRTLSPVTYRLLCAAHTTHHKAANPNLLLAWYVFLGGYVEEETFWAADKSDHLYIILSYLTARVGDLIPDPTYLVYLGHLLDFLAAWENPPPTFDLMGYLWCSVISQKLGELDRGKPALENQLSPFRPDPTHSQDEAADKYAQLLLKTLKFGFRQPELCCLPLTHTPYHHWMFDVLFASDDDEVIADAVWAWVMDRREATTGSCARRLSVRMERDTPLSHRLRQAVVRVVEGNKPTADGPESDIARLLNRLALDVGDMGDREKWRQLLVDVIRSPTGREALSSHNWCLLGELSLARASDSFELCGLDMEVLRLLHVGQNWGKLEMWMLAVWSSLKPKHEEWVEGIKRMTLGLLQQQRSALQKFEALCEHNECACRDLLRQICCQVRAEQVSLTSSSTIPNQPLILFDFTRDDTF